MNPAVGHLYHDFSISNTFTHLDAKERLRTRQINAREEKQLGKYTKILNRAMFVCKRNRELEEKVVKQQLKIIKAKTLSLDHGLRQETDRLRQSSSGSCPLPNITQPQSRATTFTTPSTSRRSLFTASYRSSSLGASSLNTTAQSEYSNKQKSTIPITRNHKRMHGSVQNLLDHQVNFNKRTENVTRTLHKLYKRQSERTSTQKNIVNILRANNVELLMKARVFFKDTEAKSVLETILAGKEDDEPTLESNSIQFDDDDGNSKSVYNSTESEQLIDLNNNSKTLIDEEHNVDLTSQVLNVDTSSDSDSGPVSSTVANPSESSSLFAPRTKKMWTEIFRAPELWRIHADKMKEKMSEKKDVSSLVTITAKYRRTRVN